eukprot:TRINITY_DN10464_c0_g2_i1.p1 TRINITY_DN10464_c0_g2~~TRINITY_DN10464_c0_g2_i1.p1  ORF type:complete len:657 (-),score=160.36 TRINITY_DN10464_c0_g2_i1:104-2074(-)
MEFKEIGRTNMETPNVLREQEKEINYGKMEMMIDKYEKIFNKLSHQVDSANTPKMLGYMRKYYDVTILCLEEISNQLYASGSWQIASVIRRIFRSFKLQLRYFLEAYLDSTTIKEKDLEELPPVEKKVMLPKVGTIEQSKKNSKNPRLASKRTINYSRSLSRVHIEQKQVKIQNAFEGGDNESNKASRTFAEIMRGLNVQEDIVEKLKEESLKAGRDIEELLLDKREFTFFNQDASTCLRDILNTLVLQRRKMISLTSDVEEQQKVISKELKKSLNKWHGGKKQEKIREAERKREELEELARKRGEDKAVQAEFGEDEDMEKHLSVKAAPINNMLISKLADTREAVDSLNEDLKDKVNFIQDLEEKLHTKEINLLEEKSKGAKLEFDINSVRTDLIRARDELLKLDEFVTKKKKKIWELKASVSMFEEAANKNKKKYEEVFTENKTLHTQNQELTDEVIKLRSELAKSQAQRKSVSVDRKDTRPDPQEEKKRISQLLGSKKLNFEEKPVKTRKSVNKETETEFPSQPAQKREPTFGVQERGNEHETVQTKSLLLKVNKPLEETEEEENEHFESEIEETKGSDGRDRQPSGFKKSERSDRQIREDRPERYEKIEKTERQQEKGDTTIRQINSPVRNKPENSPDNRKAGRSINSKEKE